MRQGFVRLTDGKGLSLAKPKAQWRPVGVVRALKCRKILCHQPENPIYTLAYPGGAPQVDAVVDGCPPAALRHQRRAVGCALAKAQHELKLQRLRRWFT